MSWLDSFDFIEFLAWYGGLTLVLNVYDTARFLITGKSSK